VDDGWVRVADLGDVPDGAGFYVEVHGFPIALWNVAGDIYATQDTCTHEESSLAEGDLWDEVVECPLHGAQFDVRTGAVLSLPAILPLRTFPVRVEDNAIYLEWTG
jgi:3-phenylpropionate/trans-cinnamate dioxygenase ferredoxin subunit